MNRYIITMENGKEIPFKSPMSFDNLADALCDANFLKSTKLGFIINTSKILYVEAIDQPEVEGE